jgi:thiol-disulfide isomerase/thioredoxin
MVELRQRVLAPAEVPVGVAGPGDVEGLAQVEGEPAAFGLELVEDQAVVDAPDARRLAVAPVPELASAFFDAAGIDGAHAPELLGEGEIDRGLAAGKKAEAIRLLEASAQEQEKAPYNLRARIWKRRNQIELAGQKAPGFTPEDYVGREAPALETLRGKPVVLSFWWEECGDCKAQAAALRRTVEKYAPKGVVFIAPTRFYETDHTEEKQKIEKAWKEIYDLPDSVTVPISIGAMLRYGASATPTFAFVNRKGIVTRYSPTRMTEERLSAAIEELLQ